MTFHNEIGLERLAQLVEYLIYTLS